MTSSLTVECNLRIHSPAKRPALTRADRVPRISRLMALAIKMENLIQAGGIPDYSALAQLGHVSRARITQIMNLLLLAPEIQEQILFWPPTTHGREPIRLAQLQPMARVADWNQQRRFWASLVKM